MKKITAVLALLALFAYLLFWPVPISPMAWQAPSIPKLEGQYATNDLLSQLSRLAVDYGVGPETIAVDKQGFLYTGYEDGRIVRFDEQGQNPKDIANTKGRPLGMEFAPSGELIIADAIQGLLSLEVETGQLSLLTNSAEGVPFKFTDDVDVALNGVIYFSDASSKFGPAMHAYDDVLEHGGHGRLLKYDPSTKETTVLLRGLEFANGVALSQDESFVLVTETGNYDVIRYWLSGEKAGTHELFYENLPGIPDGISSNREGVFWVALFAPRNSFLDWAAPYPLLREMVFRLPAFMRPNTVRHAFVLGLNESGKLVANLQDASNQAFAPVTSVKQHNNKLFLGSLTEKQFAVYSLTGSGTNQ
ncbi:MAG: SMP-30/gluconolactonase/LRE family protein [Venatoribacter sp.]